MDMGARLGTNEGWTQQGLDVMARGPVYGPARARPDTA